MNLNIVNLLDVGKCWDYFRQFRWRQGVCCPKCGGSSCVKRNGSLPNHPDARQYGCGGCGKCFSDKTGTVLDGSHKDARYWIACLYFMGLNLSTRQISEELGISPKTCADMAGKLREGICLNQEEPVLEGEVEIDEVYLVAGHKGQPKKVEGTGRQPRRRRLKGARGRGTLKNEKPPVLGIIQRGGCMVLRMLPNVQQATIMPVITSSIAKGTLIHTDEYNIYSRLNEWGYEHKTVCHSKGEYARDEDGDGHHEVHVNTQEGAWSLLRSWLRPHRGISQTHLPKYIGFFQFVYNVKKRGKKLLPELLKTIFESKQRELDDIIPAA